MKRSKLIKKARKQLLARGVDPDEAAIMLAGDVDPAVLDLYLRQTLHLGPAPEPKPNRVAPVMDPDRIALHREAKAVAADKVRANPNLDGVEAYMLAAIEIEDRRSGAIWLS